MGTHGYSTCTRCPITTVTIVTPDSIKQLGRNKIIVKKTYNSVNECWTRDDMQIKH